MMALSDAHAADRLSMPLASAEDDEVLAGRDDAQKGRHDQQIAISAGRTRSPATASAQPQKGCDQDQATTSGCLRKVSLYHACALRPTSTPVINASRMAAP